MGRRSRITGILAALLAIGAAPARFDPRSLRPTIAGPATQVMVLGTPHLSEMPKGFDLALIAPLRDRLAAYRPQVITIEALSGPECEMLARYKALSPGSWDSYCWDTDAARAATGLDVPAAEAAIATTLAAWPATPTPAQRRHLAALFLAANDRASADVQWLRLPPAERHAGDGIDAALLALLAKSIASRNEDVAIAATLAARLGLERVYPADDHTSDALVAALPDAYGAAIQAVWARPNAFLQDYLARRAAIRDAAGLIGFYRFLNDPATNRAAIDGDMARAIAEPSPERWGRRYVAWWEVRNLRMVANVRAAAGPQPGVRVLAIVGATHKAYFESYLKMMSDIDLVDPLPLLAAKP